MHAYILPYPHTYEKHSSIPANSCLLHPLYQKSRRATSGKADLLLLLVLYKNKRLWMNHHPQPASLGTHFFKEWYTKLQHRKFSRTKHYTYPSMKKKLYAFAFSSAQCFIVLNCTEQSLLVICSNTMHTYSHPVLSVYSPISKMSTGESTRSLHRRLCFATSTTPWVVIRISGITGRDINESVMKGSIPSFTPSW